MSERWSAPQYVRGSRPGHRYVRRQRPEQGLRHELQNRRQHLLHAISRCQHWLASGGWLARAPH